MESLYNVIIGCYNVSVGKKAYTCISMVYKKWEYVTEGVVLWVNQM